MITNTSSRRENKRERERERERVYSDTHTHHIPYVTFFKHLTLFELIRTFPISKKAKIFCESFPPTFFVCLFFRKKMYKFSPLFIHSNSQQIKGTRARAKSLSLSFFLSPSKTDDDCVILRVVSLSCVFSNDDRVFSERFLNSRTVVFYPILSNFASEPTRSREKTKILHSPLIEHGQRRDQSNELDHPVVAPRSVHGVSDAGAPMMQSSSSSLSSCVRNVFFQRGPLLRKVKKAFSKGPKKTKKRSRRFDFFAEKVLLWKRRRPVV